ncbi:nitroreductase/quinone reductase family protein [Nocardia sp. NPDC005366]|uniref:nitroreductase/quinone reductase family protein n=1 Tax=Nocardia sp. NPDC005366 TaxID=3156878 RepID=UPI0033B0AFDC
MITERPRNLDSPVVAALMKYGSRAQAWAYRRTRGRIGGTWRIGAGFRKPVPTLLLEHQGRRSGNWFTVPLLYITDGADLVVVASQGGRAENPQWYRNLVVHPDAFVQVGRDRRAVRARDASPEERARLWPELVDAYADFDAYQSWTSRRIPVVILTPAVD